MPRNRSCLLSKGRAHELPLCMYSSSLCAPWVPVRCQPVALTRQDLLSFIVRAVLLRPGRWAPFRNLHHILVIGFVWESKSIFAGLLGMQPQFLRQTKTTQWKTYQGQRAPKVSNWRPRLGGAAEACAYLRTEVGACIHIEINHHNISPSKHSRHRGHRGHAGWPPKSWGNSSTTKGWSTGQTASVPSLRSSHMQLHVLRRAWTSGMSSWLPPTDQWFQYRTQKDLVQSVMFVSNKISHPEKRDFLAGVSLPARNFCCWWSVVLHLHAKLQAKAWINASVSGDIK